MTISTGDAVLAYAAPMVDADAGTNTAIAPRHVRLGFPVSMRPWLESMLVVGVVAPLLTVVYRLWDAHLRGPVQRSAHVLDERLHEGDPRERLVLLEPEARGTVHRRLAGLSRRRREHPLVVAEGARHSHAPIPPSP